MANYKQLCAELTDALHRYQCWYIEDNGASLSSLEKLLHRAETALAEPEAKKPLSLVHNCHMKGMPPNPHQDWQAYFTHCAVTGTISGLRLEAIQPTPSVNDIILNSASSQPVPVNEWLPGPEDCDAEGRC